MLVALHMLRETIEADNAPVRGGHQSAAHPGRRSGAPSYGLRVVCEHKIVAYSGDTEWTDALLELAGGADLFICEAYVFERSVKYHLSYAKLAEQRSRLRCKRLVLTHMSADMLDRGSEVEAELAVDGLTVTI